MPTDDSLKALYHQLRASIQGEIHTDALTRRLYSTDASNYRILPAGVIIPRCADDIQAAIATAGLFDISITPRGSGSSLAGQAIGAGLIIDCTRWLDQILTINPEEKWVLVESGVTLDALNRKLLPEGLMVGPNPASSMVATLGGMAANNSTGSHSILYGLMVNHVLEMEVILANGERCILSPKSNQQALWLAEQPTLEGSVYRHIPNLIKEYREDIRQGYPRTWRNVAGYNLNRLLADEEAGLPLNLTPLVVGSEGTLAFILNLKINLVPRPQLTRLVVLHFDELLAAVEQVSWILEHQPSAVELLDDHILRQARSHPGFKARLEQFVRGDPAALLVVEFSGNEAGALESQAHALAAHFRRQGCRGEVVHCTLPAAIDAVWSVRKEVNGLLLSQPGDAKPMPLVDDAAVPIEHLPEFVRSVQAACREAGVEVNFDAHASAGCLHMNPRLNPRTAAGLRQMQQVSQAVMEIAMRLQGTTTGEHGEGLARSYYNEQLYGPRLHQAFRQLKNLFDPQNRMNPGKILDGTPPWQPELLRFSPQYRASYAPQKTFFDYSPHAGFAGLVEMCNGQGMCRSLEPGVMCPSFRVTRQEIHATRGRANALRAAMSGELGPQGMTSQALYEALDLCLECKACKRECSSLVDMARLKSEFLAHYQADHGIPLRSRLFGNIATLFRLGSVLPTVSNAFMRSQPVRWLLDRSLGIDSRRTLPKLAGQTFQRWFKQRPKPLQSPKGPLILWDDTYISYTDIDIGKAAVRVLEAAGFEVRLVKGRVCCGRPMISKGLLAQAKRNAAHNVRLLYPLVAQGIPIVGLEPSCIATFQDEYPALLNTPEARAVAEKSYFVEEFLADLANRHQLELPFRAPAERQRVLCHGHCYQKALPTTSSLLTMLRLLPNTEVEEIPSGCCGMAGSFGYEKEHYDVSIACGEEILFPAIRQAPPDAIITAAGVSCRQQIRDGTGRRALHPIEVLAQALKKRGTGW